MKNLIVVSIVVFVFFGGYISSSSTQGEELEDRGGAGELCYPNNTCQTPHTCFSVMDEHRCYKSIKPVFSKGYPSCYAVEIEGNEVERCFETGSECLSSFARTLNKAGKVISGCNK